MTGEDLRAALVAEDTEVRHRAVVDLAQRCAEESIEDLRDVLDLLLLALGDADWRVRKEAVAVLSSREYTPTLYEELVKAVIQGENVGLRNSALEALAKAGPDATQPLLAVLGQVQETAKKFIFEGLGNTGSLAAVPALVEASRSTDSNTAAAAVDALSRIGGADAEVALRGLLSAPDPFQRMAALDALTRLAAMVPYEELAPLLADRMTKRVALELLGRTGRAEALDPLMDALDERSPQVVGVAALGAIRLFDASPELAGQLARRAVRLGPGARESLRLLIVEGAMNVRQAAAHLAILAREPSAIEVILGLASEGALPREAMNGFLAWGESAVLPLLDVYENTSGVVSALALELAADLVTFMRSRGAEPGTLPPPSPEERPGIAPVRRAVERGLASADEHVRRAAVRSLMACAEPGDAARLVGILESASEELAAATGHTLASLARHHPDAVGDAIEATPFDWPGAAVVCELIADLARPRRLDALRAAQASASAPVRRAAVHALAKIPDGEAAECVSLSLSDDDVNVRVAAAEALGGLGRVLGVESLHGSLRVALDAETPAVVAAAARALGRAGDASAAPALRALLTSERPGVALAALEALKELRVPLEDVLPRMAHHPDEEVVKQALQGVLAADSSVALECLRGALSHSVWHVRTFAITSLVGRPGSRALLEERLSQEQDPVVLRALEAALEVEMSEAAVAAGPGPGGSE